VIGVNAGIAFGSPGSSSHVATTAPAAALADAAALSALLLFELTFLVGIQNSPLLKAIDHVSGEKAGSTSERQT